jgi:hypothetical protein
VATKTFTVKFQGLITKKHKYKIFFAEFRGEEFMKLIKTMFICLVVSFGLILTTCQKEKGGGGSATSNYGGDESHNAGQACMDCHGDGGSNELWFVVAGSVYNEAGTSIMANGTVYMYTDTGGKGTLVTTIEVDGNGNFYSTNAVSFGTGLFPVVKGTTGDTRYMEHLVTNGNCNSCHNGSPTKRVWVN